MLFFEKPCKQATSEVGFVGEFCTIGDVSAATGLPASTIRYYDKNGLLPNVARSSSGMRLFTEDDIEWIRLLERLKMSGMPIREMRAYVELIEGGDDTLEERRKIVYGRRSALEARMRELEVALGFIGYKCWFYDMALKLGSEQAVRDIPASDLPEDIQRVKKQCDIA